MFLAALFTIVKTRKQPKCPSTDEQKKMSYIYTMEYYSAIKKNEIMPFAATWMQLEIIILSEVSQKEKDKYHIISYVESKNLKYNTNVLKYKIETDSQTQRTDLWLPRGRWGGGGMDWEFGMQTIIQRVDIQQGPTVQHREFYSISCDNPYWKGLFKKRIYI